MKNTLVRALSVIAALLAFCGAMLPATVYHDAGSIHYFWVGTAPATTTSIVGGTIYLRDITLAVATGATVTVTLTDGGTDCSSSACAFLDGVVLTGPVTYVATFPDAVAPGGLNLVATGGTVKTRVHWISKAL